MTSTAVKDESHWHDLRAKHVGGSEIASLFYLWQTQSGEIVYRHLFEPSAETDVLLGCASPYLTGYRLYHIKAGLIEPDALDNTC